MCAKCEALKNSFMGRYGAIMQAVKDGTYDPNKNYIDDGFECEEYKKRVAEAKKEEPR